MAHSRSKELMECLDNAMASYDEWLKDKEQLVMPEKTWLDLETVIEVFKRGDIPAACRRLWEAVREFEPEWIKWNHRIDVSGDASLDPGNGFYSALETMFDARREAEPKVVKKIEPISRLVAQGCSERQIAVIYDWWAANGEPDTNKVLEEIENPGTHINENFLSPLERERQAEEAETARKLEAMRERRAARQEEVEASHGPESLKELVRGGVSAKQIAKIQGMTVEEVYAQCDAEGLVRPPLEYEALATVRSASEPGIPDEVERAFRGQSEASPETEAASEVDQVAPNVHPMTLEQEIIFLHQRGEAAKAIADQVSTDEMPISWQKVNAIVARFKKQPEAFGV